jgi:prepilin-type N-terminal cleavage/methylation domain-containing protein
MDSLITSTRRRRRPPPRISDEAGFTLMELMIVLVIMGILMTISIGAFTRMRDRGETSAAELNVQEALSAVHLYYAHHDTFDGMTLSALASLDAGIRLSREPVISADGKEFCIESTHNGHSPTAPVEPGHTAHNLIGPGGDVVAGPCPASL